MAIKTYFIFLSLCNFPITATILAQFLNILTSSDSIYKFITKLVASVKFLSSFVKKNKTFLKKIVRQSDHFKMRDNS